MYNTSAIYKTEIKKASRSFECRVTIGDIILTNDDIVDIIPEENIQPSDSFSIGNVTSQVLDLTILNKGQTIFTTNQVKVEIGLKIGATTEYILMGCYNIEDVVKTDYTIKYTCYDNMIKFETPYFSSLGDTPTLAQVVNELATLTGIQFSGSLPAYTVKKLEGFTCREILGYVASLCGGNAVITRDGKFTIVYPVDSGVSLTGDNYFDYKREEVKYKIGKITCQNNDKATISKGSLGTDSMELLFENPWVTDAILANIYTKLNGFEYLGYTMKWQGDISLDIGDIITVTDVKGAVRKLPILSQKFTYTGGLTAEIGAKGESKNKNTFSSSGSMGKKVDRIVTEQLMVNEAFINKAYIQDATINNLTVQTAKIQILEAELITVNNLLAGNLTSINIQSLVLTSDKVTVANGFIKDAMIDTLSVSKILAGDISTTKFRIVSDSGKMLIADNTIQIKDASRTRVQIGKDASNDYNMYVWDATGKLMFDATGLKADGIKTKIIRDDMISDTANIDGGKINISSLVTSINNGSSVIKGSRIQLDGAAQTLDIDFSTLKSDLNGKITSNLTAIGVEQGRINTLISNTTIVKNGVTTQLKDNYTALEQNVNGISLLVNGHTSVISGLNTSVESHTTSIKALDENIILKVDTTTYNSKMSSLDGSISTLNTKITNAELKITDASIIATVATSINTAKTEAIASSNGTTDTKLVSYSTTVQMNAQIAILNTSIGLKVASTTYNTKMSGLDGSVSSLGTRLNSAELKITDSAIVSTVTGSTSYINDLSNKVSTSTYSSYVSQTATALSNKVSVDDVGTLITQNSNSVKIAVGQIGGNNLIKDSDFEFGTLSLYSVNGGAMQRLVVPGSVVHGDAEMKITTSATVASSGGAIDINDLIVGNTYTFSVYNYSAVVPKLYAYNSSWVLSSEVARGSNLRRYWYTFIANASLQRLCILGNAGKVIFYIDQLQLEEGENPTAWNLNANELKNTFVEINEVGLTVKKGSISILNNAGTEVLSGDTLGNLKVSGSVTSGGSTGLDGAIRVLNSSGTEIFNANKYGIFAKNGVFRVSNGTLTSTGVSTYPSGYIKDIEFQDGKLTVHDTQISGSQYYKRSATITEVGISFIVDNMENAGQTYNYCGITRGTGDNTDLILISPNNCVVVDSKDGLRPKTTGVTDLGTSTWRWRDIWCTRGAFNGSDSRLKENIVVIQESKAIERTDDVIIEDVITEDIYNYIKDADIYTFNYIDTNTNLIGILADDIPDNIFNKIGKTTKDEEALRLINAPAQVGMLQAGLKEAIKKIEKLTKKIEVLESAI